MRGYQIATKRPILIIVLLVLAGLLLPACGSQHHLYWTCEKNYNICLDQCRSNNDFLYEKISNKLFLEQELMNCQQECALKQQLCTQADCVSCR